MLQPRARLHAKSADSRKAPASQPSLAHRPIGLIGLGLMGQPMALNLQNAGADLVVHNRSQAAVRSLARKGIATAQSSREVAEVVGRGIIILMLTNSAAVEAVVAGPDGVLAGLKPGALVIDMGSSGIDQTRDWSRRAAQLGATWLDAPVSGGQFGAIHASLTIMVGGPKAAFQRARPVFAVLGKTLTHVGASGAGQVAKLANQIIVASTLVAIAEAFTLAKSAGVEPARLRQALLGGFAASRVLDLHGQRMIESAFQPGGRTSAQLKDVDEAVRFARVRGLDLPLLKTNQRRWRQMMAHGWGDLDHSAVIKLYSSRRRSKAPGGTRLS